MTRDELKELGLAEEQIEKVMASHGKALNNYKEKADKADGLEGQISDYKDQLKDRDSQLEELKKKATGNEDLLAQIEQLKEDNAAAQKELQQKLDKQAFDFSLEKALTAEKVKNPKAVKALLDVEKIKLDGETMLGLEDQLKAIKESDAYLFESDEGEKGDGPRIVPPGNPKGGTPADDDPFAAKLAKYK